MDQALVAANNYASAANPPSPPTLFGIALAARPFYSLPQALYLPDKLLCVLGRISVVLILSAQYVVVRKYVL